MFVIFFLILCCGRGTNPSHAYIIIYIAAAKCYINGMAESAAEKECVEGWKRCWVTIR